jgi:CubicO group peptidase (beta-lactamase class C family)
MQDDATPYAVEDWGHWAPSISNEYPASHWMRYESAEEAGWSVPALADAQRFSEEIGSAAVMVVFGGAVLAHWGDIDRRYLCHSIRKSILSALYGEAVAQRAVHLQETLGSLGIDDDPPLSELEKRARVVDLLTSRSGVYLPAAYEGQHATDAKPARGSHEPGTHWHYNNWDFNVLATIFNQKTGGDMFEALYRRLAAPLQMQDFELRHGHYHFEPKCGVHPAYPLRMSTRDLARFGLLYLREGNWNGTQLVPRDWVVESTRSHCDTNAGDYGYGYMWWVERGQLGRLGTYFATGVGHRVYVIPGAQLVIVHRVDTYLDRVVTGPGLRRLVDMILRARIGPPAAQPSLVDMPEPEPPKASPYVSDADIAALCGEYAQDRVRAVIRQSDCRLEIELPDGRFYLFPRSSNGFDIEDMPHKMDFDLDETGKAMRICLWQPFELSRSLTGADLRQP